MFWQFWGMGYAASFSLSFSSGILLLDRELKTWLIFQIGGPFSSLSSKEDAISVKMSSSCSAPQPNSSSRSVTAFSSVETVFGAIKLSSTSAVLVEGLPCFCPLISSGRSAFCLKPLSSPSSLWERFSRVMARDELACAPGVRWEAYCSAPGAPLMAYCHT